ncbi:MAG: hypothetical protein CMJ39_02675 [Phycisphaerae bacterium]|nr:hypothetical protein [Phycisphaerae bacterium]|tara:strand:- start:13 stop:765 length:753 start_codon:yes stop_codon:yes gene_type:complete
MNKKLTTTLCASSVLAGLIGLTAMKAPEASAANLVADAPDRATLAVVEQPNRITLSLEAYEGGQMQLALMYTEDALKADVTNLDALRIHAQALAASMPTALEREEHPQLCRSLNVFESLLHDHEAIIRSTDQPTSLIHVIELRQTIDSCWDLMEEDASMKTMPRLELAEAAAEESKCWYWFNNRDKVIEGLRHLQWVYDRQSCLDRNTRGEFYRVLNVLKQRVSSREWKSLLASADLPYEVELSQIIQKQ